MEPSNVINIVLLIVSALAVTVAWRSTLAAGQATKRAGEMQGRLSALERTPAAPTLSNKKAVFDVFVRHAAAGNPYTLILQNKGGGAAQDFDVLWNNELFSKAPIDQTVQKPIPETVAPGESVELTMLPGFEGAKLRVVWCDESGEWQEQNLSHASAQKV